MIHVVISRHWFFDVAVPLYAPEITGEIRKPLTEVAFIARSAWAGDAVIEITDALEVGVPYEIVSWETNRSGDVKRTLEVLFVDLRESVIEEGKEYRDLFRRIPLYQMPQLNAMTADLANKSSAMAKMEQEVLHATKERNQNIHVSYVWYLFAIQIRLHKEEKQWETKKGWGIAIEDDNSAGAMNIKHAAQNANKRK